MKKLLFILCLLQVITGWSQSGSRKPDTLHRPSNTNASLNRPVTPDTDEQHDLLVDEEIKQLLIQLTVNNAQVDIAESNIRIADIARRKAGSSFLSSVNLGGNVNEFVVNNSPNANFFPKYNFGVMIPMDMLAKNKAEKRTAREMLNIAKDQKKQLLEALKTKVLINYEVYKEKRDLLELQQIIINDDEAAYDKAQKDYKDGQVSVEDLNRLYRDLISAKGMLSTREKELRVAELEIEEIIGVPLKTVFVRVQSGS